jgi:hypothetical protein
MPSGYRAPDALKDEFFSLVRQGVSVKEASARIGVWRSTTQGWLGKTGAMRMRMGVDGGVVGGPVPAVRPGSNRLDLVDRAAFRSVAQQTSPPAAMSAIVDVLTQRSMS